MKMRFVIDETSLDLNGLSQSDCVEAVESLLDRLDDAHNHGHTSCFSEDLFYQRVVGEASIWDLCAQDAEVYLPPAVQERLAAIFSRMPRWDELTASFPTDFNVQIDNGPSESAPSIAWAHAQGGNIEAVACVGYYRKRTPGLKRVEVDGKARDVWFVESHADSEKFFRWLIARYASTDDEVSDLAGAAFLKLQFAGDCFRGLKGMSKPLRQLAEPIVRHLAALSDDGQRIFLGPWQRASAEFGGLGVEVSDENGGTKRNPLAKAERTVAYQGRNIICWWHSKIEPHQDRIYFCPDNIASGGEIVVGVMCSHLTT